MTNRIQRHRQAGITLLVTLVLLMVMATLTLGLLHSARLDLLLAGNLQWATQAFQLAEAGIAAGLVEAGTAPLTPATVPDCAVPPAWGPAQEVAGLRGNYRTHLCWIGNGDPLYEASSLGKLRSTHYRISALGSSAGGALALHHQGFHLPGPVGP